jgi:hypothetical protein
MRNAIGVACVRSVGGHEKPLLIGLTSHAHWEIVFRGEGVDAVR